MKNFLIQEKYNIIATIILLFTPLINKLSYTIASIYLMVAAIVLFFIIAKKKENYFSLEAIFTVIWLGTIGLANLKLLDYQRLWSIKTWLVLSFSYFVFIFFMNIGSTLRLFKCEKFIDKFDFTNINPDKLFIVCMIFGVLSLIGFYITVIKCGFIPFFSNDINAYAKFYTKYVMITNFLIINIPICYFCLKNTTKIIKKIFLIVVIFTQMFLIPILMVNRGVFLIGALLFSCTYIHLNNKSYIKVILCFLMVFGGYEIGSIGRHYTNEMLENSFKQEKIAVEKTSFRNFNNKDNTEKKVISLQKTINNNIKVQKNGINENNSSQVNENLTEYGDYLKQINKNTIVAENRNETLSEINFKIPSKLLFLYSYLTVSHDNFDLAIKYNNQLTLGTRSISGFNFILKKIVPTYDNNQLNYYVQHNLNTFNILGSPFYDFGYIGVFLFMIIFGLLCGYIEALFLRTKSIINLLILSIFSYCVVLSFFANYTQQFIFILNIAALIFVAVLFKLIRMEI